MTTPQPLAGVRVLDFTTTFSGPYCTQLLAGMGADVIKIEAPGGDITRRLGTSRTDGMASVYVASNRDKASVVLDLKDPDSADLIRKLIGKADCLVHNMRLPAAERLGIDPAAAMAVNPRLVHAAITGFGSDGPYSGRPAYDDCIQGATGMAWLQGLGSDRPAYMASAIADKVTGQAAATAVVAALFDRERTGSGMSVEIPMYETLVGFTMMEQWGGRAFAPDEGPTGYARIRSPYRRPYRTSDGLISVVVYHGGHWSRFLEFVGHGDLLEHERFRTVESRTENIDELYELLESLIEQRSTEEWLKIFDEIDVPAVRVASLDELFDDEHLIAVNFFEKVEDSAGETYVVARPATRFTGGTGTPARPRAGLDRLGAGSDVVARWLECE